MAPTAAIFAVHQLLRGSAGTFRVQAVSLLRRPTAVHLCTPNCRKMASRRKTDHLERTVNNFRHEIISQAKVCGIVNESETVKRLRLVVENSEFSFKAGQWVDFFIPGGPKVGGFSICSSPGLLEREGVLELAVKYSKHPPAQWIHTQCTLDSEVALRVGGDFFFDPQPTDPSVDLLLIAGGVGINPLHSILLHIVDLHRLRRSSGSGYEPGLLRLCFSGKNTKELLFKKTITELAKEFSGRIKCTFHVTQQTSDICEELRPYVTVGRITEQSLADQVSKDCLCYICGPPPMIKAVSQQLENLGVPKECIHFEKWW
ncbi:oxidoreductase NAD-binding domain-containing protein 1 [Latimeria chalumnae]|uniref:Oxidoreductase NAD-binding domain-containing protein 1 n=1 Tax=Latimeria chalumnae TaxID=7897 RepID=H3AI94_LATCH|nr:PREDICTED: oxidoreductase NAD-binding domain-containing protein 1 [Latimeria chalumnae]|eukprot:XP_006002735.1 PREDICTED: oxidoreductase NAD-binding domain-containing protein 1 [Latimeria chalumnae]